LGCGDVALARTGTWSLCKFEGYRGLYERSREPEKLVGLPITHDEIYPPWLDESAKLAIDRFDRERKPI
jgi:hypothetical protein